MDGGSAKDNDSAEGLSEGFGHGFRMRADQDFPEKRDQNLRPSPKQVLHLVPLGARYAVHFLWRCANGRKPPIDQVRMRHGRRMYGAPCGAIGSGTVGRGFRGEFTRFQMVPGDYSYATVWADAFHVCVKENGRPLFQSVLASRRTLTKGERRRERLSAWQYRVKDENMSYRALYPRAWFTYELPEVGLTLVCEQVSPFIPHDYEDSTLPVVAFHWSVIRRHDDARTLEVILAFSFRSGWGRGQRKERQLVPRTSGFQTANATGRLIHQTFRGLRLTYGIAAANGDALGVFDPQGDGGDFWAAMAEDAPLDPAKVEAPNGRSVGVGVRVRMTCGSSTSGDVVGRAKFALCWDYPLVRFGGRQATWKRRYTKFFESGQEDTTSATEAILCHALQSSDLWRLRISQWQAPVLSDASLPEWLKSCVFNEMYYIADGGSQWLTFDEEHQQSFSLKVAEEDARRVFGRFCYLESHEYRLYNTYDVHFYASFALAALFPGLELSLQADYLDFTRDSDSTRVFELYSGRRVPLNSVNSVPHDLGDPCHEPYLSVNAYRIHDVSQWKDLPLKLVASIWRDISWCWSARTQPGWRAGGVRGEMPEGAAELVEAAAKDLAKRALPVLLPVMEKALEWDKDGDGLIENSGKPDQTYDTWTMTGPSAYCNSLWLSALHSYSSLANKVGNDVEKKRYESVLNRARSSFVNELWVETGGYFAFDQHSREVVMSDQLCGLWLLRLAYGEGEKEEDLPFDSEKTLRALRTIYECNVQGVDHRVGAANGFKYDQHKIDTSTVQSEESWTGSSYALSALMVAEGLSPLSDALASAEGVYRTAWERSGMAFETPEAFYQEKHYRAIGYMRPLAAWSIVEAVDLVRRNNKEFNPH